MTGVDDASEGLGSSHLCRYQMKEGDGFKDWQFTSYLEFSSGDRFRLFRNGGFYGDFRDVAMAMLPSIQDASCESSLPRLHAPTGSAASVNEVLFYVSWIM